MSHLNSNDTAALLRWYRENKRQLPWRDTGNPEDVWISEIMLQQTRVEAVKAYFTRFRSALPTAASIASCPDDTLMKLWEGLGYYSRARNLKKCAAVLLEKHEGQLPRDYHALRALPGIGPYTAGAIASIAYGLPVPAVDGNVLRVWARLNARTDDIAAVQTRNSFSSEIEALILEADQSSADFSVSDFNQALMELGAVVCVPNGAPLCLLCPLRSSCRAYAEEKTESIPFRSPKKPRRIEPRTLLIIRDGERFLLQKRPPQGLLAGLYEFPGISGILTETEALTAVRALGFSPVHIQALPEGKHIFTHIEWHMSAWEIQVAEFSDADIRNSSPRADTSAYNPSPYGTAQRISSDPEDKPAAGTDTASKTDEAGYILIRKADLQHFAVPSAFRTWINWYALKEK